MGYVFWFLRTLKFKQDKNDKLEVTLFDETSIEGFYVAGEMKDNFTRQLIDQRQMLAW